MNAPIWPDQTIIGATGKRWRARRRIVWLTVVVLMAFVSFAYVSYSSQPDQESRFETAVVVRGPIEDAITALGRIQPRAYVDIGAQASGRLDRIPVKISQTVAAGDLLAELDPQFQVAKVEAIRAEVARLQANLVEQEATKVLAASRLERQTQLLPSRSTSRSSYDDARHETAVAAAKADAIRAQIRQTEATLRAEEVVLSYTRIYAPMSGTVVSVDAREGQTLNAAYSTPVIMRIADLTVMTVWTQVSEADIMRLKPNMPVRFTTLGHNEKQWKATLREVLPAPPRNANPTGTADTNVPQQTASNVILYIALFDIENAAGELRPEMSAQVSFIAKSSADAVLVPVAALNSEGADTVGPSRSKIRVMTRDGRTEIRDAEIGIRTRFVAEVLDGVQPGERVVTGARKSSPEQALLRFGLL